MKEFPDVPIEQRELWTVSIAGRSLFSGSESDARAFIVKHDIPTASLTRSSWVTGARWVRINDDLGVWEYRRYGQHGKQDEIGKYHVEARSARIGRVSVTLEDGCVHIAWDDFGTIKVERGWGEGIDVTIPDDLRAAGFDEP